MESLGHISNFWNVAEVSPSEYESKQTAEAANGAAILCRNAAILAALFWRWPKRISRLRFDLTSKVL